MARRSTRKFPFHNAPDAARSIDSAVAAAPNTVPPEAIGFETHPLIDHGYAQLHRSGSNGSAQYTVVLHNSDEAH